MFKATNQIPQFKLTLNYIKLIFRAFLLLAAVFLYVYTLLKYGEANLFGDSRHKPVILSCIWVIFLVEMILRFFPSKLENMGCQKQFARNMKSSGETVPEKQSALSVIFVAIVWLMLNGAIGVLYYLDIISSNELILISLFYSVCDIICILFFCPFQAWIMKNKCCTTCRIYNWDYAMMFTPLVFVDNLFATTLFIFAIILLLRWEIAAMMRPERFCENTNLNLRCSGCTEKLCRHKKKLEKIFKK